MRYYAALLFLMILGSCVSETPNGDVWEPKTLSSPLNVVYIMADDLAYQAISAYGSEISKLAPTPNIDSIAQNGARLESAFCTNSICGPRRPASITAK